MAESRSTSIFVLGGLKPVKSLSKTVNFHIEDFQSFEKLYNPANGGLVAGRSHVGAGTHHLSDEEVGTVVSFSCNFGWSSRYLIRSGYAYTDSYNKPRFTIGILKIYGDESCQVKQPLFLSIDAIFKLNKVEIDSTSLDNMTPFWLK